MHWVAFPTLEVKTCSNAAQMTAPLLFGVLLNSVHFPPENVMLSPVERHNKLWDLLNSTMWT